MTPLRMALRLCERSEATQGPFAVRVWVASLRSQRREGARLARSHRRKPVPTGGTGSRLPGISGECGLPGMTPLSVAHRLCERSEAA